MFFYKKNKVRSIRNLKLQEAEDFIIKNNLDDAEDRLRWIELSKRISLLKQKRTNLIIALLILFVSTALIGISMILRLPVAEITIEIKTNSTTLFNPSIFSFQGNESCKYLRIDKVVYLDVDLEEMESIMPSSLLITGENFKLDDIRINPNSIIQIEKYTNQLVLYNFGLPVKGIIEIREGKINYLDKNYKVYYCDTIPMTTVQFVGDSHDSDDYVMMNLITDNLKIQALTIDSLNFIDELIPNSGLKKSVVLGGKLYLVDIDKGFELMKNDSLIITFKKANELIVTEFDDHIGVRFQGSVSKFSIIRQNKLINLKPTLLEYFYSNKKVAFLWSALAFIWGLLWSLKITILQQNKG